MPPRHDSLAILENTMALKDRLNDALNSTPGENTRRLETLRAILASGGDDSDAGLLAAISKTIAEREQTAASYRAEGLSDLEKAERDEIDALRGFLRSSAGQAPAGKPKPGAPGAAASGPSFSRKQMIIGGAAIVVLAVMAVLYLKPFWNSDEVVAEPARPSGITVLSDDRTMGNPKAPVTLLEYAAPTCPFCARFAMTAMPGIKTSYIDTGKVFYIFRAFPINAPDGPVEAIARCLPPDKYFAFIDLMFRNQAKWDPDGHDIPDVHAAILQMARVMGVSAERADQCIADKREQARMNSVAEDGVARYGIPATPTFVINGAVVELPFGQDAGSVVRARLDAALAGR
jgi:protein-disulfide isomerase